MIIKQDCKFFKGYMPCIWHKKDGTLCADCTHYVREEKKPPDIRLIHPEKASGKKGKRKKILIIKLSAVGDVIRTTPVLPALRKKYPRSSITWLTAKESVPVFDNNPYVHEVIPYEPELDSRLQQASYDIVANLEPEPAASRLAAIASNKSVERYGYFMDRRGFIEPHNQSARYWFESGLSDELKKENRKTYQEIIFGILNLKYSKQKPVLILGKEEKRHAEKFRRKNRIPKEKTVIGLNTGAGKRWKNKSWPIDSYVRLITLLTQRLKNASVLIYGGPEECGRNKFLKKYFGDKIVDTGCRNTLREFMALLDLADIVVTADTMALHIASALNKHIVALFGPTSANEIEMYSKGIKICPDMGCLCCYLPDCDISLKCMQKIAPSTVFGAILGIYQNP